MESPSLAASSAAISGGEGRGWMGSRWVPPAGLPRGKEAPRMPRDAEMSGWMPCVGDGEHLWPCRAPLVTQRADSLWETGLWQPLGVRWGSCGSPEGCVQDPRLFSCRIASPFCVAALYARPANASSGFRLQAVWCVGAQSSHLIKHLWF